MKSQFIYLIDAGHGGFKNGVYTTAPAKMHTFPDGLVIHEGMINRAIARYVWMNLVEIGIDFKLVYDEHEDDSLKTRVERVNAIVAKEERTCILISIHSNASPEHTAIGNEIFVYTHASERSKKVAHIFCETYIRELPEFNFRKHSNDQLFKQANHQITRETKCPAILLENLFFDERRQAEFLLSTVGQQQIACAIVQAIQNVEYLKPI